MLAYFLRIDWNGIFASDTSPIEIFIRGTLMYFGILLLLRFVVKRETGALNRSDLLVIVLIADAAQNGMTGDYHSVVDGLFLVGTILFWSFTMDWLSYHNAWFERFVQPKPLLVFKDGNLLRRNMQSELITFDELLNALRKSGYKDFDEIKEIYLEGDGSISVIPLKPS